MRIAVLWKRRYMGQDVIDDRYARLYELPRGLAARGHAVRVFCLGYRGELAVRREEAVAPPGELVWRGAASGPGMVGGLPRYWRTTLAELRAFRSELVLAGSDAPHTILAQRFARRLGVPYVIDLYDNYESFGLTQVPGMRWLYRRALRAAAGIAAVSAPLAEYVQSLAPGVPVLTLESTVDPARFFPRERGEARARLKLPAAGRLVGVSGSLNRNRGIDQVYASFLRLSAGDPRLFLVLAGDVDPRMPPPAHPRVLRLGRIPHEAMPLFFSALDLALVPMIDTAFGRHAFPQKAYEILACQVPLLTARVGALARTLAPWPQCLYAPDDAAALDLGIRRQLERPVRPQVPIPSWDEQAGRLEDFVRHRLASVPVREPGR